LEPEERNPSNDQNTISRRHSDPLSKKIAASGQRMFIQKFHMNNIFGLPDPPLAIPSKHGSSLIAIKRLIIQGCLGDEEKYMSNDEESQRWDLSQLEDLEFINTRISSSMASIILGRLSSIRTLKIKGRTIIVREDSESDIPKLSILVPDLRRIKNCCSRLVELALDVNMCEPNVSFALNTPMSLVI
jgi:hypothetical protein